MYSNVTLDPSYMTLTSTQGLESSKGTCLIIIQETQHNSFNLFTKLVKLYMNNLLT